MEQALYKGKKWDNIQAWEDVNGGVVVMIKEPTNITDPENGEIYPDHPYKGEKVYAWGKPFNDSSEVICEFFEREEAPVWGKSTINGCSRDLNGRGYLIPVGRLHAEYPTWQLSPLLAPQED